MYPVASLHSGQHWQRGTAGSIPQSLHRRIPGMSFLSVMSQKRGEVTLAPPCCQNGSDSGWSEPPHTGESLSLFSGGVYFTAYSLIGL